MICAHALVKRVSRKDVWVSLAHQLDVTTRVDNQTCSFNMVLSDDANAECAAYLQSTKSMINVQKFLITGNTTDLINLALHNYTWAPKK